MKGPDIYFSSSLSTNFEISAYEKQYDIRKVGKNKEQESHKSVLFSFGDFCSKTKSFKSQYVEYFSQVDVPEPTVIVFEKVYIIYIKKRHATAGYFGIFKNQMTVLQMSWSKNDYGRSRCTKFSIVVQLL